MKSAVRIVIALGLLAAVAWLITRFVAREATIAEPVEHLVEPEPTEAPAEELAEASV
jgi:flagellar biogenesis protein FliO